MIRISRISRMAVAALVLIFGNAIAADQAEAQPANPEITSTPEQQPSPKPKEEADSNNASSPNAGKEEPACN